MYHNKTINIRIDEETHNKLLKLAEEQKNTISQLLRSCIINLVDK